MKLIVKKPFEPFPPDEEEKEVENRNEEEKPGAKEEEKENRKNEDRGKNEKEEQERENNKKSIGNCEGGRQSEKQQDGDGDKLQETVESDAEENDRSVDDSTSQDDENNENREMGGEKGSKEDNNSGNEGGNVENNTDNNNGNNDVNESAKTENNRIQQSSEDSSNNSLSSSTQNNELQNNSVNGEESQSQVENNTGDNDGNNNASGGIEAKNNEDVQSSEDSSNNSLNQDQSNGEADEEEKEEGDIGEDEGEENDGEEDWGENGDGEWGEKDDEDEDDEYEEDEEEEEDESWDEEEDDEDDQPSGYRYNTQQVVELTHEGDRASLRYVQTEFYRFIEMFAEERLKIIDYSGEPDAWNVKRLMFRQYERKPLSAYRCSRVRDTVVLILDNSGSMEWWAENLRIIAALALMRNDVEIYIAPNGHIEERLDRRGRHAVRHEEVMKSLQGRRIIYVGDYDGGDTPIELSWRNDVVWIAPETRYRRFRSHDWVHYDEEQFRGVFIRAYDLSEMFQAFKRVSRFYRLWIDLHEDDNFEDD